MAREAPVAELVSAAGGPRRSPAGVVLRAGVAVGGFWVFLVGVAALLGNWGTPVLAGPQVAKLGAVLVAALALAAAFHPLLRLERRARFLALLLWAIPLLATPLLFGPDQRILRVPAAIWSALLIFKLYDVHLSAGRGRRPDGWSFLSFLSVPLPLMLREVRGADGGGHAEPAPWSARPWAALIAAVAGSAIFVGSFRVDWTARGFLLEHAAKAVGFFLIITASVALGAALVRALGGHFPDFTDRPFLSRTPAEFWRRYNLPVGRFLYEDVFKPAGGLRRPVAGILTAFAVSGAFHEYIFSVAVGRVQGYQIAFFLVSGLAVAATARLRPRGAFAVPGVVATLVFLVVSSVFFFLSLDSLVPFYSEVPPWLAEW